MRGKLLFEYMLLSAKPFQHAGALTRIELRPVRHSRSVLLLACPTVLLRALSRGEDLNREPIFETRGAAPGAFSRNASGIPVLERRIAACGYVRLVSPNAMRRNSPAA